MSFTVTFSAVAVMLLYALPGFLLIKTKAVNASAIPAFAKLLMYVSQPCLTVYSFQRAAFSWKLLGNMGIFFGVTLLLQIVIMGGFFLAVRRRRQDVRMRVCSVAACFGNVAFMGVPLVESLLPDYPEAVAFSSMFFLSMSLLGWTAASAVITQNMKYISVRKILINPAVLPLIVAIPLFFTGYALPDALQNVINILAKMTTPLCMLVVGMRLATMRLRPIFTSLSQYVTIAVKQLLMPLAALVISSLLPIDYNMKVTLVILCACPVASIVLNYAEILGEGQETAANLVLLGTLSSVISVPLIMLLV